jgi:hypothetical protein
VTTATAYAAAAHYLAAERGELTTASAAEYLDPPVLAAWMHVEGGYVAILDRITSLIAERIADEPDREAALIASLVAGSPATTATLHAALLHLAANDLVLEAQRLRDEDEAADDALMRDSAAAYAREVCDPVAADRRALAREVRNAL